MPEFNIHKDGQTYHLSSNITQEEINDARESGEERRAARLIERQAEQDRNVSLYREAAGPLLHELENQGYKVQQIADLYHMRLDYRPVIPILLRHLSAARYLPLAEDIVRTLSIPSEHKQVVPALLALIRQPPELYDPLRPADAPSPREHLREVAGIIIGNIAKKDHLEEFISIVEDDRYGTARCGLIEALGRIKDDRAINVLMNLLGDADPQVVAFAVRALGRQRAFNARQRLEIMVNHDNDQVRRDARAVLRKFDKLAK
ncbi:HEAT repeat domain-containing protein [Sphaerisporangium sp. NPDC005288]|uniref:HEAT repeat domain-containing protein n=1 Tax=Sphaerisporangium sp. NPDC005288 TaxID=3155114 RepID=UPI0033B6AC02